MARRGIHEPVHCYLPAHLTVCHRHQRWIGQSAHGLDDQLDLHDRPQVLGAARTHKRLARQYSEIDLRDGLREARHILVFWAHAERCPAAAILHSGLQAYLAAYPDVIAGAAILLTVLPWVEPPRPDWPTQLLDRINQRIDARHTNTTPIEQWVQKRRLLAKIEPTR
jgi:hypothetical protein